MAESSLKDILLDRIRQREAHVGIIGLGYVGLPLAVEFARQGLHVTGFDVDASKAAQINAGKSYIPDVPTADLAAVVAAGRLRATTDMSELGEDGRRRHLRADAAAQDEGSRSVLRGEGRRGGREDAAPGTADHPRIDDVSRDDG